MGSVRRTGARARRRILALGAVGVAALLVSGCGATPDGPPAATPGGPPAATPGGPAAAGPALTQQSAAELSDNPCPLLTDAEVAQAMRTAAEGNPDGADGLFSESKWDIPEQPLSRMVLIYKPTGGQNIADIWARYPADYPPPAVRRDVGDTAVWEAKAGSIQVVVGDVQFSLSALLSPSGSLEERHPLPEAELLRLARLVAFRVTATGG